MQPDISIPISERKNSEKAFHRSAFDRGWKAFGLCAAMLFAFLHAGECRAYTSIQLAAFTSKDSAFQLIDSVAPVSAPVYMAKATLKGDSYYRVRIGPFVTRAMAEKYARFFSIRQPYFADASNDTAFFEKSVKRVIIDTLMNGPQAPSAFSYYFGRKHAFAVFYLTSNTNWSGIQPARLRLYTPNSDSAIEMPAVTGFQENDSGFAIGLPVKIYEDPEGAPISSYIDSIRAFAKERKINVDTVMHGTSIYGDIIGQARFTMEMQWYLPEGKKRLFARKGFDYITENGARITYAGNLAEAPEHPMFGNEAFVLANAADTIADSLACVGFTAIPCYPDDRFTGICIMFMDNTCKYPL